MLRVEIAFSFAAVILFLIKILPIKEVYRSVDWPVIILLATMIPVGKAFETIGAAAFVTNLILSLDNEYPIRVFMPLLMVITLVMGPGGYKFSDYWKMGLPITLIIILGAYL